MYRRLLTSSLLSLALLPGIASAQAEFVRYEVDYGDSLWSVASGFGCTVSELQEANGLLDDDVLQIGQVIEIPRCSEELFEPIAGYRFHEVDAGDDLEDIADQYGCSIPEIAAANAVTSDLIYAGDHLAIPMCGADVPRRYGARVRAGDDLPHFARRHECNVEAIVDANDLHEGLIRAGQRLVIPDGCEDPFAERLPREVDTTTLTALVDAYGVRRPRDFGAYVVEIVFDEGRRTILEERRYDYDGTSTRTSWNPASTVKLYPAITALRRIRSLGFDPTATLTFEGGGQTTVGELVREALGPSNNVAYDYLVTFTGLDELNAFLTPEHGFDRTGIARPYALTEWMNAGMPASLRYSPAVLIEDDSESIGLAEYVSTGETFCGGSACTTLADLGETLRRIMLQEYLGEESFELHWEDLAMVRDVLGTTRERGEEVVTAMRPFFDPQTRFYHKAGYSRRWYSDNVFIDDPTRDRVWVVTLVGHGGRDALDQITPVIAELLSTGALQPAP